MFWIIFVCFSFKIEIIRAVHSGIHMVAANTSKVAGHL